MFHLPRSAFRLSTAPLCELLDWFVGTTEHTNHPAPHPRITALHPEELESASTFSITRAAHDTLRRTVGARPAETGAVLGGDRATGLITHVHVDQAAAVTAATYSPDIASVNRLLREKWDPAGIEFLGFVHSHPRGYARPSRGDEVYASRILTALPKLERMLMPIIQTKPDTGRFSLHGFVAVREPADGVRVLPSSVKIAGPERITMPRPNPFLERVRDAYDPAVMATSRIAAIGVGGSVSFLETLARGGLGQFVLIDPDIIEAKNVGTQAVDPADIGRPKVEALANRLARLNPNARIWTIQARESTISDVGFHRLLREALPGGRPPGTTLLCAFTDNFPAQDRVQRLGLHFGVGTLAANVHAQGRSIEAAFAAPGVTRACIRCAQSSRYRKYLQESYVNDVTSEGTPFTATNRLNALKELIAYPLLHQLNPNANQDHPATVRWRGLMSSLTDRNLALTRLDPASPLPSFAPLGTIPDGRCIVDETVWPAPTPDGPGAPGGQCPDCGGTGDLADSIAAFVDTRILTTRFGEGRRSAS